MACLVLTASFVRCVGLLWWGCRCCHRVSHARGVIIPPLPEKNAVQKFQMSTEFIEDRRRALQVGHASCFLRRFSLGFCWGVGGMCRLVLGPLHSRPARLGPRWEHGNGEQ